MSILNDTLAYFTSVFQGTGGGSHGEYAFLSDVIVIFSFTILIIVTFRKLKISPVLGYLFSGALIGPYGLNIVGFSSTTKSLAEFGVVFLMFSIGLEMTLQRIKEMKKYILEIGSLQFVITSFVLYFIAMLLFKDNKTAIIVGSALALSSTAIVLKLIIEKDGLSTIHGKVVLAVLLFQDLIAVPMFVLVPVLMNQVGDTSILDVVISIVIKSLVAFSVIFIFGRIFIKYLLSAVAKSNDDELFIATTLFIVLSSAFVTESFGLSMALGAFVAGLMIAETEYQHYVESHIVPFKGLFLGLFFITIGMNFNSSLIFSSFVNIVLLAALLIFCKFIVLFMISKVYRLPTLEAIKTGLLLSQGGEFAFILFEIAQDFSLFTEYQNQFILIVIGMSMIATPFLDILVGYLSVPLEKNEVHNVRKLTTKVDSELGDEIKGHVIIAGCGKISKILSELLTYEGIDYLTVDKRLDVVKKYTDEGIKNICYGDVSKLEILKTLRINASIAIVINMSDYKDSLKALKVLKSSYPNKTLIVRISDEGNIEEFRRYLGPKDHLVLENYETGLQLGKMVLGVSGVNIIASTRMIASFRRKNKLNPNKIIPD